MKSKIPSKIFWIVAGFLSCFQAHTQGMFVKADTYVYAGNQYVYIKTAPAGPAGAVFM